MTRWLMGSSLRFGRLVIAAAVGLTALAVASLGSAKVDILPEFMPPSVQVQTEALGLSAAEVEQLITVPIEQDLLNGVPWLDRIHSMSQPGLSAIDIVFEQGTDIYAARQMVQERLTQAHALPNVGTPPVMIEPLASASRVSIVALSAKDVPLIDMSVLARWKIRPRLMGISGVANVAIYGQRDRQLQVQVDPAQLAAKHVSLTQVIETAGNAMWVSPLTFVEASTPGTGGFVETANQRLAVQHVLPITTASNLAQVPVEGAPPGSLRLGDVAEVVEDHQPLIGDAVGDGDPTLFLVVQKFPGASTVAVTEAVEDAMAGLQPGLAGITVDTSSYRPATLIESAVGSVGLIGLLGLVLLAVVLLLSFSSWRLAVVSLAAVVVSLAAAVYVLYLRGETLTTMTLIGVSAALVLVVHDAVADVAAVRTRLQRRADGQGVSVADAVVESGVAARGTLLVATVIVLLAVLPLLALSSLVTAFTRPAVGTFALALALSMVVAVTVTATLAAALLRPSSEPAGPTPLERLVRRLLCGAIGAFSRSARLGWLGALVLAVGALALVPQLGDGQLLPRFSDRNLLVAVHTQPGTSLTEMDRLTGVIAADIRRVSGVRSVGAHVGRAVTSDQLVDVNSGELWIDIADDADYAATQRGIRGVTRQYPGVASDPLTYSADRVDTAAAGSQDDLVVRLLGQDYATMQTTAERIRTAMAGVPGVRAATVRGPLLGPTAQIEVDLAAADRYGLRPGDVRREATTLASGLTVGSLYEQAKVFDVVVLGTPSVRADLTGLGNALIGTPDGGQVRLADVAKITVSPQPTRIIHDQVQRSVDVVAQVTGGDAAGVANEVTAAVSKIAMPSETHLRVLGSAVVAQADSRRALAFATGAVVLVFLLLQVVTASWRRAAALLVVVPLGCVGGVLVAPLVGGIGTAGAIGGLVAVFGLTARTGLMAVRRLRDAPPNAPVAPDAPDAPVAADANWAAQVVQAGLAIGAVLVPMAILGDRAGVELLRPMAVTALGGLLTSLFVTLFVVPSVCPADRPRARAELEATQRSETVTANV
ncbi:MAG TPA: efflux RND transporter permease subunit [Dermatophilaceae bacterium]|nr:efflux RND transporter permease subunit [Dermatophilaceae bacterium]